MGLADRTRRPLHYVNEFGNGTAVFENLVRGKFHFEKASNRRMIDAREALRVPSLDSAVLVDKDGQLSSRVSRLVGPPPDLDTPERAVFSCNSLIN